MLSIFLGVLTFLLVLVSLLLILVVLSQKAKSDGGVGAAMGGGMAEAAFGAETNTVLTKMTITLTVLFFVLSLGLYLGRLRERRPGGGGDALPNLIDANPIATPLESPLSGAAAIPAPPAAGGDASVPATAAPTPAVPAPEAGN